MEIPAHKIFGDLFFEFYTAGSSDSLVAFYFLQFSLRKDFSEAADVYGDAFLFCTCKSFETSLLYICFQEAVCSCIFFLFLFLSNFEQ